MLGMKKRVKFLLPAIPQFPYFELNAQIACSICLKRQSVEIKVELYVDWCQIIFRALITFDVQVIQRYRKQPSSSENRFH